MKKNLAEFGVSEELFEIVFNTKENSISAHELCLYLSNFEKAFKSINHTINREYCAGFDFIELDIIAFEKGSFNIKSLLKKYLSKELTLANLIAIFALLANLMSENNRGIDYNINGQIVNISNDTIRKNRETIESVRDIASAAVSNPNIVDLSFVHKNEQGKMERVSITKENLNYLASLNVQNEDNSEVCTLEKINLVIFSPVLDNEVASWKFIMDGRKISAKMTDVDFLEKLENHDVVFGKGDIITVDLETRVTKKDEYSSPTVRHYVTKVHKYPIQSNQKPVQLDIF